MAAFLSFMYIVLFVEYGSVILTTLWIHMDL